MAIQAAPRPKSRGGRPLTIIGVLVAVICLLGFVFLSITLSSAKSGPAAATGKVDVVVAAKDIHGRSSISPSDVTVVQFTSGDEPPRSFHTIDEVKNRIAVIDIPAKQALSNSLLAPPNTDVLGTIGSSYLPLTPGWIAMTIPTSEMSGVAGYIQPGDYIAMIAVVSVTSPGQAQPVVKIRTVFTNVHVLRLGQAADEATSTDPKAPVTKKSASSMTIVVTQCQAEYIQWFISNSKLTYTLPSSKDYNTKADAETDPTCSSPSSAQAGKGVTSAEINQKWPGLLTP